MILDFLEIWVAVVAAFVGGAFVGALVHDRLAGGRLALGQAAVAEVVAMAVDGNRAALVARRERRAERLARPKGRQPPMEALIEEPLSGQLDRIKGIDPAEVARLGRAGYGRLDQLARWSAAEVAWIADQMAISPRRVARWVARAQTILRREEASRQALPTPNQAKAERQTDVPMPPAPEPPRATPPRVEPASGGGVRSTAPGKAPAPVQREELTPYEIALDLELRKP